jgi:integrase
MKKRTPSYCLHKGTGQAVVRIDGRDHYLGAFGTKESRHRYNQLIAEWYANAKTLPPRFVEQGSGLSVAELLLKYWEWAEGYYQDNDGEPSAELLNIKHALKPARELYGLKPAKDFGPLALRAIRDEMARRGLCRTLINNRINRIKRAFKWAASFEVLPASVYEALRTVPGIPRGRGLARESDPVKPVTVEIVETTVLKMPPPVAAMAKLQVLTGMRAGEVLMMRAIDLTMGGTVWTYTPHKHKNRHRGMDRIIHLGPQAQEIIKRYLTTNLEAYLFSPKAHVEKMRARRAAQRKTKRTPSEINRKRRAKPKRQPAERYDRRSYRQAIVRACKAAKVPPWSPLQLRHTAATLLRAKYGLEAAKVILGHARVETAEIYAERDLNKARDIMREIG